jgi:hypothetical protein
MDAPPLTNILPFSLCEGDLVNRGFARLGLRSRWVVDLAGRGVVLWFVTWFPMAFIALAEGYCHQRSPAENFFYDIAAYAQLFVGLPLFIVAESFISASTREGARHFAQSGILSQEHLPQLALLHRQIEDWRRSLRGESVCIAAAYLIAYVTLLPLLQDNSVPTWHTQTVDGHKVLTWAGWWVLLITLPLVDYWWIRWIWKTGLWCWYLYKVSRLRLVLVASHPDRTGGLGFISEAQSKFGLLILAYGITNVAATVAHELVIEKLSVHTLTVWGPILSFVIGAPLLFTVPLFVFTKQLYRTKRRAIAAFQEKAVERALTFEKRWLKAVASGEFHTMSGSDLSGMSNLNSVFDRLHSMRVVPFDLRSFGELVASAVGPILPLLPYLDLLPDPLVKSLEKITRLLGG